jgi:hypothetical protein
MPTSQQLQAQYTELTDLLDLPDLSGSVVDRVHQLINQLRDEREAKQKAQQDTQLLNWLNKNIHVVPMSDFDMRCAPNSNEWGFYAPKQENGEKVYGCARAILGAAMRRDEDPNNLDEDPNNLDEE